MGTATLSKTKELIPESKSQGDDGDIRSDFRPHLLHDPHQPVPIALVNRYPTGSRPFPFILSCKQPIVVSECRTWTLPRPPKPTRHCLA